LKRTKKIEVTHQQKKTKKRVRTFNGHAKEKKKIKENGRQAQKRVREETYKGKLGLPGRRTKKKSRETRGMLRKRQVNNIQTGKEIRKKAHHRWTEEKIQ